VDTGVPDRASHMRRRSLSSGRRPPAVQEPGSSMVMCRCQMWDCKVDGGLRRISFLCSVVEFVFILRTVGKPLKDFK